MKNSNRFASSQIFEKRLRSGRVVVFSRTNNFKIGEIDFAKSTFYSVARSTKNIFRMFQGLGINAELLVIYNFTFIEIPFNTQILRTTKEKWLREGIASKYSNNRVDPQIILPLSKINLDQIKLKTESVNHLSIFEEVA